MNEDLSPLGIFGETRLSRWVELVETTGTLYTNKLFTGQREMAGLGIYHYGARFYSPKLGRFLSADSIVPNPFNPRDFNRFSYVRNNPVRYVDPSGMVYLRARYYMPSDGRFLTRDTWEGDYNSPLSLNRWMYVEGNPVNFTDPTGNITEQEAKMANFFVDLLRKDYNVKIEKDWGYPVTRMPPSSLQPFVMTGILFQCGDWEDGSWRSIDEIKLVHDGVKSMSNKLGGGEKFRAALWWMPISFKRMPSDYYIDNNGNKYVAWTILDVKLYNSTFDGTDIFAKGTIVHELAHVWDTRQTPIFSLSSEMSRKTKSYRFICSSLWSITCPYKFDPNGLEDPPTDYGRSGGEREDFADSFAICVYPSSKGLSSLNLFPIRKSYIEGLINGNKCSQ